MGRHPRSKLLTVRVPRRHISGRRQPTTRCATQDSDGETEAREDEARVGVWQATQATEAKALHRRGLLGDGLRVRNVDAVARGSTYAEWGQQSNGLKDNRQDDKRGGD